MNVRQVICELGKILEAHPEAKDAQVRAYMCIGPELVAEAFCCAHLDIEGDKTYVTINFEPMDHVE